MKDPRPHFERLLAEPALRAGTQIHYPCPNCGNEGPHTIRLEDAQHIEITCGSCGHEFEVRV